MLIDSLSLFNFSNKKRLFVLCNLLCDLTFTEFFTEFLKLLYKNHNIYNKS